MAPKLMSDSVFDHGAPMAGRAKQAPPHVARQTLIRCGGDDKSRMESSAGKSKVLRLKMGTPRESNKFKASSPDDEIEKTSNSYAILDRS